MDRKTAIDLYSFVLADKSAKQEYINRTNDKNYAQNIDPEVTLADVFQAINNQDYDKMDYYDAGDSFVRETLFQAISEYTLLPYDFLYNVYCGYIDEARQVLVKKFDKANAIATN